MVASETLKLESPVHSRSSPIDCLPVWRPVGPPLRSLPTLLGYQAEQAIPSIDAVSNFLHHGGCFGMLLSLLSICGISV